MRLKVSCIVFGLLVPLTAFAQQGTAYSWVDDDGVRHYGDRIPAEYADKPKDVVNEYGVVVGHIRGKRTAEQIQAEKEAAALAMKEELQRRADLALLSTYANVTEIEMHRDRRIELFQAQARVTELYLRNLRRRLSKLKGDAGRFKPYNSNPEAPMIDPGLIEDIKDTEGAIMRHEDNLKTYRAEERRINERFDGDIQRFMILKGLVQPQSQEQPERLAQAVPE